MLAPLDKRQKLLVIQFVISVGLPQHADIPSRLHLIICTGPDAASVHIYCALYCSRSFMCFPACGCVE